MHAAARPSEAVAFARQQGVGDLLRRSARRYPDKTAVVASGRRVTYAEFDEAVNRCANSLTSQGLGKGDRLGLLSHNSWQFAVLAFAAARLGLVLVPVNFMLTAPEVAYILEHADVAALVAEDSLVGTAEEALRLAGLEAAVRGMIVLSGGRPEGYQEWADVDTWIDGPGDDSEVLVAVEDDDPIRLMYTSGTESRPKGVLLTSRSLISQYVSCAIDGGMDKDDVELHTLPLYHCAQLDCFFGVDVYLGATSIILPAPDAGQTLATIEREGVTKLFCPPTVWISLLRHPDFDRHDLSTLVKGYYGASAMPVEVLREIRQRLPHLQLWNFYGQTRRARMRAGCARSGQPEPRRACPRGCTPPGACRGGRRRCATRRRRRPPPRPATGRSAPATPCAARSARGAGAGAWRAAPVRARTSRAWSRGRWPRRCGSGTVASPQPCSANSAVRPFADGVAQVLRRGSRRRTATACARPTPRP